MRLKRDWQVELWELGGEERENGAAVVWYPARRVSLSDQSSGKHNQNYRLCVRGRERVKAEGMRQSEGEKERERNGKPKLLVRLALLIWTHTDTCSKTSMESAPTVYQQLVRNMIIHSFLFTVYPRTLFIWRKSISDTNGIAVHCDPWLQTPNMTPGRF